MGRGGWDERGRRCRKNINYYDIRIQFPTEMMNREEFNGLANNLQVISTMHPIKH